MKVLQREADIAIAVFVSDWSSNTPTHNWKGYGNLSVVTILMCVVVAHSGAVRVNL